MQNKFIIEDGFWQLFPDAKIGIVTAYNIDNTAKETMNYQGILNQGMSEAKMHLLEENFTDNPVVFLWREAYQQFKTKKGARSSIEAMLKRVSSGKGIGPINPLVDIYNTISLKYGMPCGGENIDAFKGAVKLTLADGDEEFITLGSDKSEPPHPGEVIYKDDTGAICRCWNWRESVRTMLTEETTNAFLCVELIQPERYYEFRQGLYEMKKMIEAYLGGDVTITVLDSVHRELAF
ncbi:MAG: B3/4 domain-containing protein [Clostridia bacterium]|nr:B3/4 domain-containing protein [Clostridia bacterium]